MSTSPDSRPLPPRPSLEYLKKEAKDRSKKDPSLTLTAAQFQIAREYGYRNWAELAHAVSEIVARGGPELAPPTPNSAFRPIRIGASELKPKEQWQNAGRATASACFETQCWAAASRNFDIMLSTVEIENAALQRAEAEFRQLPPAVQSDLGSARRLIAADMGDRRTFAAIRVISEIPNGQDRVTLHTLWRYEDGRIRENRMIGLTRTGDGWKTVLTRFELTGRQKARLTDVPEDFAKCFAEKARRLEAMKTAGKPRPTDPMIPVVEFCNRGNSTAEAACETLFWANANNNVEVAAACIAPTPAEPAAAHWIQHQRIQAAILQIVSPIDSDHFQLTGTLQALFAGREGQPVTTSFDHIYVRTETGWRWQIDDKRFVPKRLKGLMEARQARERR